jgi:hypothetical protein
MKPFFITLLLAIAFHTGYSLTVNLSNKSLPNLVQPLPGNVASTAPYLIKIEYFYDTDPGYGQGISVPIPATNTDYTLNLNLAITGMSAGLHLLHVRAQTNDGRWSHTHVRAVLFLGTMAGNGQALTQVEYFIDTDPGYGNGTQIAFATGTTLLGNAAIPVALTSVSDGVHALYVRVRNQQGQWSHTHSSLFLKLPATPISITRLEYYFDTDPGLGNAQSITYSANPGYNDVVALPTLSITGLATGSHQLYVRAKDSNTSWSPLKSAPFYITCGSMYTLKTGNWTDPTVWSCGALPGPFTTARINSGHIITIPGNITVTAHQLELLGQLKYQANALLRLTP